MKPVVVVGSLNADLVARVSRFPGPGETTVGHDFAVHPGGKGANQAYAAGRLGARVRMVGRVGSDDRGRLLVSSLEGAGVDTTTVQKDPGEPTGVALITIDASGQNQIVIVPGANGLLSPEDVERERDLIASAGLPPAAARGASPTVEAAARMGGQAGRSWFSTPPPREWSA